MSQHLVMHLCHVLFGRMGFAILWKSNIEPGGRPFVHVRLLKSILLEEIEDEIGNGMNGRVEKFIRGTLSTRG